jgi:hypothetical protein
MMGDRVIICAVGMQEDSTVLSALRQIRSTPSLAVLVVTAGYGESTVPEFPKEAILHSMPCWSPYEDAGVRRPPDEIRNHPALARQALNDHKRFATQGFRGAKKLKGYQGQRWA